MKHKTVLCLSLIGVIALVISASVIASGDQYEKLLKKQGYKPLNHPRDNFGVGTLIPVDSKKNVFIAAPAECFPGLDEKLQEGKIKLLDSVDDKDISINASGKYAPGGTGFLQKLSAAFGFSSSKQLNVAFGKTEAIDLTKVGFETYLKNRKIPETCVASLRDPKTAVIFSIARVESLSYTFKGQKNVNGSINVDLIKSTAEAQGSFKYDHNNTDSFTIKDPMYVGYNAYTLTDLKIETKESGAAETQILSGRIVKKDIPFPLDK